MPAFAKFEKALLTHRKTFRQLVPAFWATTILLYSPVKADITYTGDVQPADPSTWNEQFTLLTVGNDGNSTLTINNGSTAACYWADIGTQQNQTGIINIDGSGTMLTVSQFLTFYSDGRAILNIMNGATVTAKYTYMKPNPIGSACINFGPNGGTLNTDLLCFKSNSQLTGTGTINTHALETDIDLLFDANHPVTSSLLLNNSGQNITINMNLSSSQTTDTLVIGSQGNGSVTIRDGQSLYTAKTILGYQPNRLGIATVDGTSSIWTMNDTLHVGYNGTGTLNITHGGYVNASSCYLGFDTKATGIVTVDGMGSKLAIDDFFLGKNGTAKLNISNGSMVNAQVTSINKSSQLAIMVDGGSQLNLGNYLLTNNGIIRLAAGPQATSGNTYTPIIANKSSTYGTIQTLGGKWNPTTHIFTASAISQATAGSLVTIDCSIIQRIQISDPTRANNDLYAAFACTTGSSNLSLTASLFSDTQTSSLLAQMPTTDSLLSAWNFTTTGYTTGDPVFLSFDIGSGYSANQLTLWHFDGSTWTKYSSADLNYNGTYASFTVTGFSGYAITATPVPEPTALGMLTLGILALLPKRRNRTGR